MANNYCQSSSFIEVPEEKLAQARKIVQDVIAKIENEEDVSAGFLVDIENSGVWIRGDEYFDSTHAEILFRALVQGLDLPGVHKCSWAYTCSKLRIDEFGGGAFAMAKDVDTIFVEALSTAAAKLEVRMQEKASKSRKRKSGSK